MNTQLMARQLKGYMTSGKRIRALVSDNKTRTHAMIRELADTGLLPEANSESTNRSEAAQAIEAMISDGLVLNDELPDSDALDTLESLKRDKALLVIFVTEFAVHALDCLLQPVDRRRFQRASNRAKHSIFDQAGERREQKILQLLKELKDPQYIERLVIKAEGRIFLLDVENIHYIQAEGNYVAVHNGQREYLLRETISGLEARLDPKKFLRVHRSAIVKIDKIRELQPWFHGEFRIILDGGKQLMLSRNYRVRLQNAIGNAL